MTEIYAANIADFITEQEFCECMNLISPVKKNRLLQYHFQQDLKHSRYADIMIRYLAKKHLGVANKKLDFMAGECGKPYLAQDSLYYKISHSGKKVLCIVSDQEVGIDIEEIKYADMEIAERFLP